MKMRKVMVALAALVLVRSGTARADIIPYPNIGTINPVVYTFTAASTGSINAYFAGASADYEDLIGLLINGVPSSAGFGLDNKFASVSGIPFNLGNVTKGDTLTFVMQNKSLSGSPLVYSNPTLNGPYDSFFSPAAPVNHVYSTAYTATSPIITSVGNPIPAGTFVAFEDRPASFPPDYDYNDVEFVFTNVATSTTPEPSSLALLGTGLAAMVAYGWRRRQR